MINNQIVIKTKQENNTEEQVNEQHYNPVILQDSYHLMLLGDDQVVDF